MARCGWCGELARLDLFGRWMISCTIALVLPLVLLYGDVFYSGHLFVVSMLVILAGWRILCFVACPYLALERAPSGTPLDRNTTLLVAALLFLAASAIDGFMASRFE